MRQLLIKTPLSEPLGFSSLSPSSPTTIIIPLVNDERLHQEVALLLSGVSFLVS